MILRDRPNRKMTLRPGDLKQSSHRPQYIGLFDFSKLVTVRFASGQDINKLSIFFHCRPDIEDMKLR